MYVVLSIGPDGRKAMPFETSGPADAYAVKDAWEVMDGEVDEVEIHQVATEDRRIARDRVLAGNSPRVRSVAQARSADHVAREEKAEAIKFLASVGMGDAVTRSLK